MPDLEAAEREAAEVAVLMARDHLPAADDRTIIVEVMDGDGQRMTTVKLTMTIDRAKALA